MGPQPRPNPCPIPAPLNEGLSIDTTSPMTSICHLQEVYGHKAEKMRQKSLKCPQAPALSSDDDVLSSPLAPHVGWKCLRVLPQILLMPSPRLSAPDTMDPLDRARALAKLLPDSVPEAKEGDKIYDLGALCPEVFAQTNCEESMTADCEYIDPIYNGFLVSQFSVEAVSGEICRGKNGVDGLLDFLEWFTKYQALDNCLYQGKLALLAEAMRKISPDAFDLSLSRGQSPNPFMATLSSGAISSQQQSMLPPLPQQQSMPPPHPQQQSASPPLLQQWSMPPPPLQQQFAFLPHQWSALPPRQQSVPLPLFLEAEPDHVHALGSDDEGVLPSMQMCSNKWLSPDGPQEQPLSTPRADMHFADLAEVHDHCDIDEEEVTLEGGYFSKEECSGIYEIYLNILALAEGFGKKHC